MSQIHKVIKLNAPFKIFEFTPFQLLLLVGSAIGALIIGANLPKDCKVGNLPGGLFVFLGMVGVALMLGKMSELKPWIWWRNMILYKLKLEPTIYLPKPEAAPIYPDPNIIEVKKKVDEYYVEA